MKCSTQSYRYKLADSVQEYRAYCQLRQIIFCQEQGLFATSDIDRFDAIAYPIVALAQAQVIGVVRIYEPEPGVWYGGRLGVRHDYRRVGQIGRGLIYQAVTTAHAWGCHRFLATVQQQNVNFFRRLHWSSLQELTMQGCRHHLMAADLNHYPSNFELRPPAPGLLPEVAVC